jgi:tetratricopeptide (TPR) repeat protein
MIASHLHLGMVHLARGEATEAIECAQRALQVDPGSQSARTLLADGHHLAVHGDGGEQHLRELLERHPEASFPQALMGSRLQERGEFGEAETCALKSIELQPVQGFAYFVLAHNRKLTEADRPLIERIEEVAKNPALHPSDRRYVYFSLGKAYDDLGQYERAINALDLANGEPSAPRNDGPSSDSQRHAARVRAYKRLFTPEFIDRYSGNGLESDQPIVIFGMPRSGTTLLEQILSRHSKVGAAGEQSFWRDHRRRIIDPAAGTMNIEEMQRSARNYLDLLSGIAPGREHVTDKFPSNYVHLAILHLAFPNARFLHARRNPVDTCLSIYMRPFLTLNEFGHTKSNIVQAYRLYQQLMEHWETVLPAGRFLEVRYEEMVDDPEGMTRKVLAYCGLDWEDACLRPEAGDRRVKTFSKWQVRQPVYRSSVDRWRNYAPWLGSFADLLEEGSKTGTSA